MALGTGERLNIDFVSVVAEKICKYGGDTGLAACMGHKAGNSALEVENLCSVDDVRITKTSLTSKDALTLWIISFSNADKNKIIPGKYIAELPDETLVYTIAEGEVIDVTILDSNNK